MSGAGFILAINIAVAGLLATVFMMIAFDRAHASARWIALGYVFGMSNAALELLIADVPGSRLLMTLTYASFLAALVAFDIGLARKYAVKPPWRLLGLAFAVALALNLSIQDMARESMLRQVLYQAPYAALQGIGVWLVLRAPNREWIDNALAGLLTASSLHFLAKPLIAAASGGVGDSPQTYLRSTYALFSQSLGTVFAVAVALLMLAIYVRSMLADATIRSETDALSGLFNRRGFEDRAESILNTAARTPMPVSFAICDLDGFKATNDTFGHAAGDRVIAVFAGVLRDAFAAGHVVGRIGGEEFAIVMPGADLATARLAAEGARIAFAGQGVDGLPEGQRFTASFGVAEWHPGEAYPELLRRADAALYEAKRGGRNRVRVAAPGRPESQSAPVPARRKFRSS
ncbi:MAG: GGDEF domain-containing protein [Mesorhizobium sp.]|nr:GGDEF domain-containing protein [Mesorhizobium sp.]